MKKILIVLGIIFLLHSVAAAQTKVNILLEKTEMGAVLRIVDPDSNKVLDTASMENLGTGLVIATFETSLKEVDFLVLIIDNGEVVQTETLGPFETGNEYTLDFRKGAKSIIVDETKKEEPKKEPAQNESKQKVENKTEQREEVEVKNNSNKTVTRPLTGNAISEGFFKNIKAWFAILSIIAFISVFALARLFTKKTGDKSIGNQKIKKPNEKIQTQKVQQTVEKSPEEKEIEELEKKLKENEEKIQRLLRREQAKKKIEDIRRKIEEEEKVIENLESKQESDQDNTQSQ